jgi:hypothetical protein
MEGTDKFMQLSRRDVYQLMLKLESEDPTPASDDLEDITQEIKEGVKSLTGIQMLCKPNLDLNETMSSFEVMHPKMDARMKRHQIPKPQSLKAVKELCDGEKQALFKEILVQIANW